MHEYLIKWKGNSSEEDCNPWVTWEPKDNVPPALLRSWQAGERSRRADKRRQADQDPPAAVAGRERAVDAGEAEGHRQVLEVEPGDQRPRPPLRREGEPAEGQRAEGPQVGARDPPAVQGHHAAAEGGEVDDRFETTTDNNESTEIPRLTLTRPADENSARDRRSQLAEVQDHRRLMVPEDRQHVRLGSTWDDSLYGDIEINPDLRGGDDLPLPSVPIERRVVNGPPMRPRIPTIVIDEDDDVVIDGGGSGEVDLVELERSLAAAAVATPDNSDSDAARLGRNPLWEPRYETLV